MELRVKGNIATAAKKNKEERDITDKKYTQCIIFKQKAPITYNNM